MTFYRDVEQPGGNLAKQRSLGHETTSGLSLVRENIGSIFSLTFISRNILTCDGRDGYERCRVLRGCRGGVRGGGCGGGGGRGGGRSGSGGGRGLPGAEDGGEPGPLLLNDQLSGGVVSGEECGLAAESEATSPERAAARLHLQTQSGRRGVALVATQGVAADVPATHLYNRGQNDA
ncbi:hypothetical protein J437_LFUL014241 [Ladona fulva]|uniref:Uncharacterized protein n=1 Tax=Ladona fulva TaxID=123851 RepID=A0A8K0P0P5_LADFU|nr:hypothetical protein J437_LFUL014241 [Ladona fulva]